MSAVQPKAHLSRSIFDLDLRFHWNQDMAAGVGAGPRSHHFLKQVLESAFEVIVRVHGSWVEEPQRCGQALVRICLASLCRFRTTFWTTGGRLNSMRLPATFGLAEPLPAGSGRCNPKIDDGGRLCATHRLGDGRWKEEAGRE